MEENMKELSRYLRKGEQVRWQGKTGAFQLLERDVKGLIVGKWIGTVAAFSAILLLYIRNVPAWNAGIVGVILMAGCLLLLAPVLEWNSLLGQKYWITDQRAILMTKDRVFCSMELGDIDVFRIVRRQGGQDCLLLGSGILDEAEGQLRWYACHPKGEQRRGEETGQPVGMVFYGVTNTDDAAGYLRDQCGKIAA